MSNVILHAVYHRDPYWVIYCLLYILMTYQMFIIDDKLKWTNHISYVKYKIVKASGIHTTLQETILIKHKSIMILICLSILNIRH